MIYLDRLYGKREITDELALEIIESAPFQRLKYIDSGGYRPLYVKLNRKCQPIDCSRYGHSIGVYLLLKDFGAPREEQIAGLIHDVSHPIFSHCAEYAFGEGSGLSDHQDNHHDQYVRKSEIAEILKKHSMNLDYILDDRNFPLKENQLPDLCADRIDYMMRDVVKLEEIGIWEGRRLLKKLKVIDNKWVFEDFESAEKFARLFGLMNDKYYASFKAGVMYGVIGDYLKHAIKKGYLAENDFWMTDHEAIKIINKNLKKDDKLQKLWQLMNGKIEVAENKTQYDRRVLQKSRIVDPLFIGENHVMMRVSGKDKKWGEKVMKDMKPREFFLKYNVDL